MRIWEAPVCLFNYTFNEVATVFYERYPNSYAKHILSEDVISREIRGDEIITKKLIVKKGASFLKTVPKWISGLAKVQTIPTIEESIFDRRKNTLVTYTRNVSFRSTLKLDEKCIYQAVDSNKAEVTRSMAIDVNYGRFDHVLEKVISMTLRNSIKKTVSGFNEKLEERFGKAVHQMNIADRAHHLKQTLIPKGLNCN